MAAEDKKIIEGDAGVEGGKGYLTVRGLTFKGNGTVSSQEFEMDGGCFCLLGVDFLATDCVFDGFTVEVGGGDGSAVFVYQA